ncbi:MAG TPA: AI-2E family transporter [Sphingomicrobium sp.]|jgi:predicted PurR-regulated permease PerM|nr:AI-2E family transporter [Sphingomicrobium sp.]
MAADGRGQSSDRIFIRRVLIALGLFAFFFLTWELRGLVLMLFGAVVVATVFRAIADPIRRWTGVPEGISLAMAVLVVVAIIGAIGFLFGSQIGAQFQTLGATLPNAWEAFERRIGDMGFGDQLEELVAGGGGAGVLSAAGRMAMVVTGGIADTLVVIFGGIFLASQPRFYKSGAIKLIPPKRRELIADAMDHSERALRLWLKAQLISMTVVGTLTGLGLWLLGMPSALALGLIAFALEFIPFAGPILAAIPAVLIALLVGPEMALWVAGLYLLVQQLEGNVVYPLIQQWAVHVPAAVLLFALIGFGMLFGIIGIIFAAPLTVVTYVLVKRLYVQEALDTPTPMPGDDE